MVNAKQGSDSETDKIPDKKVEEKQEEAVSRASTCCGIARLSIHLLFMRLCLRDIRVSNNRSRS